MFDLIIKNAVVVTDSGCIHGGVAVDQEKIQKIFEGDSTDDARNIIDAQGKYVVPGGVDPHVHIRYPGGAQRENFYTGTCAAAAGGTTTIIEHPISTPPQYSPEILEARKKAFREDSIVDGLFLGAAGGDHIDQIQRLAQTDIVGFKTFLHEPPEGRAKEFEGLCCSDNYQLYSAVKEVSKTGKLIAAHTEDNDLVSGGIKDLREQNKTFPRAHAMSRPPMVEVLAVERLLTIAKETGCRAYLVHISTPQAVRIAMERKLKGQEIYIETCPHYLYMDETWLDRYGSYVKCNPALRSRALVDEMWKYVENGAIDVVASDHAPYTVEEKEKCPEDIFVAPSGFPGLETRGPFVYKAVKDGKISIERAVELLSTNPAKIFGIKGKGRIAPGYDADLVILDPYEEYELSADKMFTKAKNICHFLDGVKVSGRPETVILRGNVIFEDNKIMAQKGSGRIAETI